MKQFSLALFFFSSILSHSLCLSISLEVITNPQDLQYITNFVYWSYQRSQANYKTQKAVFEHLQDSWSLWHTITKIRLNPAHYPLLTQQLKQQTPSTVLTPAFEQLHRASAAYIHALDLSNIHTTRQTLPISAQAQEYIRSIRSQARYKSARIILAYLLTHAAEFLQKTKTGKITPQSLQESLHESLGTLSSLGAALFGKTDIHYTKASDSLWQKFLITQKLQHNLWLSIEQARAAFYLKQYTQCYAALHKLTNKRDHHTLIIDEQGLTTGSQISTPLLPRPDQLIQ